MCTFFDDQVGYFSSKIGRFKNLQKTKKKRSDIKKKGDFFNL
jgi:hypothetical protein